MHLLRSLLVCSLLFTVPALASQTVFKVLEQDEEGNSTHRALDRTTIGDGLDPVLQFILLDAPVDPDTMQVIWEASEAAIPWAREAEEDPYRMVEHALLPEDAQIEYRIFVGASGIELTSLRHVREEDDASFGVDPDLINDLSDGQYDIHAHLIVPERPTLVLMQRIEVSDEGADEEVEEEIETKSPALEPGEGWSGPTKQPAQIGNVPYEAIARWNVVPEQTVNNGFTVGVIAHHIEGIDRVEIAANGGPWIEAKLGVNPRTKCKEYFVELNGVPNGLELRAIAYPTKGKPRLLEPLVLNHSQQVVDLPAGNVDAQSLVRSLPEKGWLIFRGHPDGTTLVGGSRGWRGHVKFENLTWTPGSGGGMAMAEQDRNDWIWLDRVKVIGNGRADTTWWTTHMWGRSIFTGCALSKLQNVFHGGAGDLLARNVKIHDCYEDVFRAMGLAVNIEIDGIDRGDEKYHPAVWSFSRNWTHRNHVFQNIKGKKINAAGLSGGHVDGVALVDIDMNVSGHKAFYMLDLRNMLIQDSRLIGGGAFRDSEEGFDGVMIRNSKVGWQKPFLPADWNRPGVTVSPSPRHE